MANQTSRAQVFATPGAYSFTPTTELVHVTMAGGGGGGAGTYQGQNNNGGRGGTSAELVVHYPIFVTPGIPIAIVIGAAGPKAEFYPDDLGGTPGGDTSFGRLIALGARRGQGGGVRGGISAVQAVGGLSTLESPRHIGGSGGSDGGRGFNGAAAPPQEPGFFGPGHMGHAVGGQFGLPTAAYAGGGAGGAATPWGVGGEGGLGGAVGGSSHGPGGNTGGHPATANGLPAAANAFGAGGGGAGGCGAAYSAKLVWGGAAAGGYLLLEWVE